jgi:hypothetical protein
LIGQGRSVRRPVIGRAEWLRLHDGAFKESDKRFNRDSTSFNRFVTGFNRFLTPLLNREALISAIFPELLTDLTGFRCAAGAGGQALLSKTRYRN